METAGRRFGPYLHFGTQRANAAFAAASYSMRGKRAGTSAFRVLSRLSIRAWHTRPGSTIHRKVRLFSHLFSGTVADLIGTSRLCR